MRWQAVWAALGFLAILWFGILGLVPIAFGTAVNAKGIISVGSHLNSVSVQSARRVFILDDSMQDQEGTLISPKSPPGFGIDDSENFDRMVEVVNTRLTRKLGMNYGMTRAHEGAWKGQEKWQATGLRGCGWPQRI